VEKQFPSPSSRFLIFIQLQKNENFNKNQKIVCGLTRDIVHTKFEASIEDIIGFSTTKAINFPPSINIRTTSRNHILHRTSHSHYSIDCKSNSRLPHFKLLSNGKLITRDEIESIAKNFEQKESKNIYANLMECGG
jgi:hypothetical protein